MILKIERQSSTDKCDISNEDIETLKKEKNVGLVLTVKSEYDNSVSGEEARRVALDLKEILAKHDVFVRWFSIEMGEDYAVPLTIKIVKEDYDE